MLRGRMKLRVRYVDVRSHTHAKGLNGVIKILIIDSILIVINSRRRVGHFVADEYYSIDNVPSF